MLGLFAPSPALVGQAQNAFHLSVGMIERLENLGAAIRAYIDGHEELGVWRTVIAERTPVLYHAFTGVLLDTDSLTGPSNQIPSNLQRAISRLSKEGIRFFLIDEKPGEQPPVEGIVRRFSPTRMDGEDSPGKDLAKQIALHLDETGFDPSKLVIIATFGREVIRDALVALARLLPTYPDGSPMSEVVLGTDFDSSNSGTRQIVVLPPIKPPNELLTGPTALNFLLKTLLFARAINIRETASLIQDADRPDGLFDKLEQLSEQAQRNLRRLTSRTWKEHEHLRGVNPYDDRSGAVCFTPKDWRRLCAQLGGTHGDLVDYFTAKLTGYWQPGRPCFKRILFTPTKVLLRGEQYYVHMKNISPLERINSMTSELGELNANHESLSKLMDECELGDTSWKLVLAFLDQLRNIGLQFFSFAHAAEDMLRHASSLMSTGLNPKSALDLADEVLSSYGDEKTQLHGFVNQSVRIYYSWLLGDPGLPAQRRLKPVFDKSKEMILLFTRLCTKLENFLASFDPLRAGLDPRALVRRWREADHPGENLFVCLDALRSMKHANSVDAVGIGWGGIELPLVFRYLVKLKRKDIVDQAARRTFVATWSHYRNEMGPVGWISFPRYSTAEPEFSGEASFLFDDNVLTGKTLERVREEMLLRGATSLRMYVARFSSERRWHHMQMKYHGVADPDFMLKHVRGFIGETPFARSWSKKRGDYTSQIGVFSLPRRRILECIHNNSTVEAWDREGF